MEDPDALEFAGLDGAQQLGLKALRDVGDFIEKERAAIGHFEAAHAVDLGVGEGAFHVAEQLAFENALGEPAGIHGDQGPRGSQRNGVQRLRDESLAGAVFAGDQDIGVGRAHPRDHVQHRPHGRGVGDELREALGAQRAVFRLQALAFAQRPAELDLGLEDGGQPRIVPGLLNEIARAAAHRLDRQFDASPTRSSR